MRDAFSETVKDERVTLREGTFETTGVQDGSADLVIIAQVCLLDVIKYVKILKACKAFHWCPDYDRASTEFARILKPDGAAVFIWNLEDRWDLILDVQQRIS